MRRDRRQRAGGHRCPVSRSTSSCISTGGSWSAGGGERRRRIARSSIGVSAAGSTPLAARRGAAAAHAGVGLAEAARSGDDVTTAARTER